MSLPRHPGCPFCIQNGKVSIIYQNEFAYLIAVRRPTGKVMPWCYFAIPKEHYETMFELPADWWERVKEMVRAIPEPMESFNITLNEGPTEANKRKSGKRLAHVHFWIVLRDHEDETYASYELGFAAVLELLNAHVCA